MGHGELEQNTRENDKIKGKIKWLVKHMTCTVQTQLNNWNILWIFQKQNKEKLWIIQTIQVWYVYIQKKVFSLVIDILDTFIQKLIQTYKGPTKQNKQNKKNYLQTNNTQKSCIR